MKETGRQALDPDIKKSEATALRKLWDDKPRSVRGTQEVFGEKYQLGSQSVVGQYLRGEIPLNLKAALAFSEGLGCNIADFSPRLAAEIESFANLQAEEEHVDDFTDVRRLSIRVAAGHGQVPCLEEELGSLKFRRDFLRSVGVSESNAVVVSVKGASMEPTIADGAALLINRANREPRSNGIYVFYRPDDGLVVKRVVYSGGQWIARSDNDDRELYPDFPFEDGYEVIGRAVWMGAKL